MESNDNSDELMVQKSIALFDLMECSTETILAELDIDFARITEILTVEDYNVVEQTGEVKLNNIVELINEDTTYIFGVETDGDIFLIFPGKVHSRYKDFGGYLKTEAEKIVEIMIDQYNRRQ